jgi:hypothetical protein
MIRSYSSIRESGTMMMCQRQISARSGFESRWELFLRNQPLAYGL